MPTTVNSPPTKWSPLAYDGPAAVPRLVRDRGTQRPRARARRRRTTDRVADRPRASTRNAATHRERGRDRRVLHRQPRQRDDARDVSTDQRRARCATRERGDRDRDDERGRELGIHLGAVHRERRGRREREHRDRPRPRVGTPKRTTAIHTMSRGEHARRAPRARASRRSSRRSASAPRGSRAAAGRAGSPSGRRPRIVSCNGSSAAWKSR